MPWPRLRRFRRLMKVLHERSGQRVAVLVDEYDKPILDALEVPEIARANRDFLRGLYCAAWAVNFAGLWACCSA